MKYFFCVAVLINLYLYQNVFRNDYWLWTKPSLIGATYYRTKTEKALHQHGREALLRGLKMDYAVSTGYSMLIHVAALLGILVRLCQRRWRDALYWLAALAASSALMYGFYWLLYGVIMPSQL